MATASVTELPLSKYETTLRTHRPDGEQDPTWLQQRRQESWERFESLGLPTRKWEAWKYFQLNSIVNAPFKPAHPLERIVPEKFAQTVSHQALLVREDAAATLVFINGVYQPDLSFVQPDLATQGVVVSSLQAGLEQYPGLLSPHLAVTDDAEENPFVAINTSMFQDGVFLYVPTGVTLDQPVACMFLQTDAEGSNFEGMETPKAIYPRILTLLEEQAQAELLVQFVNPSHQDGKDVPPILVNTVQEGVIKAGAVLNQTVLHEESAQSFNLFTNRLRALGNAKAHGVVVTLGGRQVRHETAFSLPQPEARAEFYGLNVLKGNSQVHLHTRMDHQVPDCTSEQVIKGILDDTSQSEFDGIVRVAKGASGTDAQQLNKNLLLSRDAQIHTRPWLYIDTDDVSCAHGATVGQLDEEELFYLQSRGLDGEVAQCILTFGFAADILREIPNLPLRQGVERRVLANLGQSNSPIDCGMSCVTSQCDQPV